LSSFRVKRLISLFSAEIPGGTSLTGRPVRRCSVSVVAHYRDFSDGDKPCFKKINQPSLFCPNYL
ncbi:hypothetical protein, partial [Atlantibacter hermannii]|uniref:hypothetical protein n=1 Tax=Atlantibacter hermannii TaxID=565 RepID=UPI001EE3E5DE